MEGRCPFHFTVLVYLLIFLLSQFSELETAFQLSFGLLLLLSIFGFTALMDFYAWAPNFELFRGGIGLVYLFLTQTQHVWEAYPINQSIVLGYFIASILLAVWAKKQAPQRRLVLN